LGVARDDHPHVGDHDRVATKAFVITLVQQPEQLRLASASAGRKKVYKVD